MILILLQNFLFVMPRQIVFGNALGGTASAWKLATRYNIPCYNLGVKGHLDLLYKNVLEKLCEREELY